ncbi:uncharacterized protein LOC129608843 [Condylostylus longicornis]|uniref:uncharacterized protein LOC129608843 n=1 Tax=Condylostylus longicornis TaxID=2530218 RepID=UPI00244DFC52|nr:uncharacterized protein LOC129608843 [Condylostylus longicornis]
MYFAILSIFLVIQSTAANPLNESKTFLKKRDLDGALFPLVDLISNVENSLIKTAYSAGSLQGINKLRSERQVEHNSQKNPETQLSILTVKLNPQAFDEDIKSKSENFKAENTANEKSQNHSSDEKEYAKTILKSTSEKSDNISTLEKSKGNVQTILNEGAKNETEKAIAKTVAEIEVTPILLASRP